jgi:hypothetical protein
MFHHEFANVTQLNQILQTGSIEDGEYEKLADKTRILYYYLTHDSMAILIYLVPHQLI